MISHNMKKTKGQFGHDKVKIWPAISGVNRKGGMKDVEFSLYLDNSNNIYPLHPDMEDIPGKRVCGKIESGLGREFWDNMLYKTKFRGLYIYPSLIRNGSKLWTLQVDGPL